jgi:hypothetical protein
MDVRKSAAAVEAPHDVDGVGLMFISPQIGVQGDGNDEPTQASNPCRGAVHKVVSVFGGLSPSVFETSQGAELGI